MTEHRELVVVGSGPAGYTAAVYAARANLRPLVLEGLEYGGALMTTTEVENFPGHPESVMGPDLMARIRLQASRFGADLVTEDAIALELDGPIKVIRTDTRTVTCDAVILAMGAAHRRLGLQDEDRLSGRGVSSCATCDGFFFRDSDVAVVGGGDTAMEEALFLTRFASSVTVIHRRAELRASPVMIERARADPKIQWCLEHEVVGIEGDSRVNGLHVRHTGTGAIRVLRVDGVFVAIGHDPRSAMVVGQVEVDEQGYVVTSPGTATSIPGVFAAGDLVDHVYRQAITAAGSGCQAALDAQRFLATLSRSNHPSR